jgi:glutamate dehydrogenase/leucine dehydrogenase
MAEKISDLPEFDDHEHVMAIADDTVGLRGFIAIHRGGTAEKPALGATRLWNYKTPKEALRDALQLSRLMSYKAAVAGFKYGGGKAVLMLPKGGIKNRRKYFAAYADKINSLKGRFITGTDVGVTDEDVRLMKQKTPYVIGDKLDPAYYTAIGVVQGIKIFLKSILGSSALRDRSFAIQGVGKVGSAIIKIIYRDAGAIFIADTNPKKVAAIKTHFPKVVAVRPSEIYKLKVDVVVPCALGGTISEKTIDNFHCKMIVGSANNQLTTPRAGALLYRRGIWYAPDYIVNIGGLIGVVDEYEHGMPQDRRILKKIRNTEKILGDILKKSIKKRKSPDEIADQIVGKKIYSEKRGAIAGPIFKLDPVLSLK